MNPKIPLNTEPSSWMVYKGHSISRSLVSTGQFCWFLKAPFEKKKILFSVHLGSPKRVRAQKGVFRSPFWGVVLDRFGVGSFQRSDPRGATLREGASPWTKPEVSWSIGYGSKFTRSRCADFGPCFHLPGFHFGTGFLSHSQMAVVVKNRGKPQNG